MSRQTPPELVGLLELLNALNERLPMAAPGCWERREEVQLDRRSLMTSRLDLLVDYLKTEPYDDVAETMLIEYCGRSAEVIRAELAKPLGYEIRPASSEVAVTGG